MLTLNVCVCIFGLGADATELLKHLLLIDKGIIKR
jgi:hypothetical protein